MLKKSLLIIVSLLIIACSTTPLTRDPASVLACKDLIEEILQANFVNVKKSFGRFLEDQASDKEAELISKNLDALLFVDYIHSIDELYHYNQLAKGLTDSQIGDIYQNGNYGVSPFQNYLNASAYLFNDKPKMSFDTLKEVHKKMMADGVDGIPLDQIGVARKMGIMGNATGSMAIDKEVYEELQKNVYLNLDQLRQVSSGKYEGYIHYANIESLNPKLLEKIKSIDKKLFDDLVSYQAAPSSTLYPELTERMVNTLMEDLLSWFVKQRDQIGDIESAAQFKKFVNLIAQFQRDMISIHPFRDGNGRSVRQFALYYPFWLEGLPPPRLVDVNNDIYVSVDKWAEQIADGVGNSLDIYKSMKKRMELGFPIESTPELFAPSIPKRIQIGLKSGKGFNETFKTEEIDPGQFVEYYIQALSQPEIARNIQENPGRTYNQIVDKFETFYKKSHMYYDHQTKGREKLGVNFVDIDFKASFANKSFKDAKQYKTKMERWYRDETIWRGLSRQDREIEESEIVSMFSQIHYQFSSNQVMGQMRPQMKDSDVRRLVFNDFDRYNSELFTDKFIAMARDHSESGPQYGISYGYSTSKNRTVGKAFAMGAMVIAPYGKHQEMQHLLKSRVLVGMKRANKDVDLTRLKQLRNSFSYKYGRQQEVMGIGAADPDSVDFVQLIGADGGVLKSFVRNPKKPSQVLVFESEVSDLTSIPGNPIQVIDLD